MTSDTRQRGPQQPGTQIFAKHQKPSRTHIKREMLLQSLKTASSAPKQELAKTNNSVLDDADGIPHRQQLLITRVVTAVL